MQQQPHGGPFVHALKCGPHRRRDGAAAALGGGEGGRNSLATRTFASLACLAAVAIMRLLTMALVIFLVALASGFVLPHVLWEIPAFTRFAPLLEP